MTISKETAETVESILGLGIADKWHVYHNQYGAALIDTGMTVISVTPRGDTQELRGTWETGYTA